MPEIDQQLIGCGDEEPGLSKTGPGLIGGDIGWEGSALRSWCAVVGLDKTRFKALLSKQEWKFQLPGKMPCRPFKRV